MERALNISGQSQSVGLIESKLSQSLFQLPLKKGRKQPEEEEEYSRGRKSYKNKFTF